MIEVLGTKGLIKFVRLTFFFFGREFYHVFEVFRNVLNLQGKLYGPCAFLYHGIVHVDDGEAICLYNYCNASGIYSR